jgi:hypothetical protein
MKRPYQRIVFVVVAIAVVGLSWAFFRPADPLAGLIDTERQIIFLNKPRTNLFMRTTGIFVWAMNGGGDEATLSVRLDRQFKEQASLGNLAKFQIPLLTAATNPAQKQQFFAEFLPAARRRFPEGAWRCRFETNTALITARPGSSNQWVRLITDLQTAR